MARDDRAHGKFVGAGLAVKDVITWHQIPVKTDNGEQEVRTWPLMLPHDMALSSVSLAADLTVG